MPFEAVDEAMDYLYFMQEVTNAYSTELTWALALVLGLTCLYIWRALGLQEAERLHSRMVSSRPVFTSFPSPTSTTPSSMLTAEATDTMLWLYNDDGYKNRFAHKDRSCVNERERVNAVGYDILHTIISRKRNSLGMVDSSGRSAPGLHSSVWDSDLSAGVSGTCSALVSTPMCHLATRSIVTQQVPVNRQENMDAKDIQPGQQHPFSYIGNQHPHHQKKQQQIKIDKIHQQVKQHQQQKLPCQPTFDDVAKDEPGTLRHPVSNLPLRYRTPSPGTKKVYPVPAPRDKTPQSTKPRIESLFSELARHTSRRGDGESIKNVDDKKNNKSPAVNRKDKTTSDVRIATDVSVKYKNVVKSLSAIDRKMKENSHLSDHESPPGRTDHEKTKEETEKNTQSKGKCQGSTERVVDSLELNSTSEQCALPQKRARSNKTCTTVDKEMMECLRRKLLTSKDDETSCYKLAKTFLSEFAKSQPIRRSRRVYRESEQPPDLKHWDILDAKHSKTKHLKTSDTRVCKKRSKTTQKPVYKCNKKPSVESIAVIKSKLETKGDDEPYDSAVLRAIKADEENEKAERLVVNVKDSSKTMSNVIERGIFPKNASGDGELDRNTATREAGRRLAKLRKRLEDSLEQMQKQSGSDRDLAEISQISKLRMRREELERLTFMKDDILELETLTIRTDKEVTGGPNLNSQQIAVKFTPGKVSKSHPVRSPVLVRTGESDDGGSNFPTIHNSVRTTKFNGICSSENGIEKQDNNVTKIIANFSKTSSKEDSCTDKVGAPARLEIKNMNVLETSQRLVEPVTADSENATVSKPDIQSHKREKELSTLSSEDNFEKNPPTDDDTSSPPKCGNTVKDGQGHETFMTRSGKRLDEDSLDEILEHQSKLREALKQRKKSPLITQDTIRVIATGNESATAAEKCECQNANLPKDVKEISLSSAADEGKPTKQHQSNQVKGKATTEEPETKPAWLSPRVLDGTSFPNVTKPPEDTMSQVLAPSSEEKLPEDGGTDNSLCVSATTFSHKYKESEVQQTQQSSVPLLTSSPIKLWGLGFDPTLAGERENYARRRIRWRRHAERMERQRVEAVAETHKIPPPVLPKQTHLNDTIDNNTGQQETDAAAMPLEQEKNESKFTTSQEPLEGKLVDNLHIEGLNNNILVSDIHSSGKQTNGVTKPLVSPKPIRRSTLPTVKDKNLSLAAGETGLVKGPPDNVEICEEKVLSPSKAASVFDPKAQLEREKEKVEAERATRNTKERMPPSQFKANVHLFEQAAAAERAKSPTQSAESKLTSGCMEQCCEMDGTNDLALTGIELDPNNILHELPKARSHNK